MAEIDNLEIVVTAETDEFADSLKKVEKTLSKFSDSLSGFGNKMRVDGVETKMKSVSKAMRGEEARVKQIASDMAEDFIHNFNIKNTDVQNKIRSLSDSIFGSLKREGFQLTAGDTRDYQKQLIETILGDGKLFSVEAGMRKKELEEFYNDLIDFGRKYGSIKLPEGMKSPSFEGAPLPGNLFSKDGADFTADSFITERYKHLFSDDDLKTQEDVIARIVELTKEYRSIWATEPLGENEIKYISDSIRDYGQQAINVLKEPITLTKELKEKFKDFGKDWTFKGTTQEAETNLKSLEKQLENAKLKVQGLVIKDRIIDSSAYVDAIANVQLLTNKIETLRKIIDDASFDASKLSENLTISTMGSNEPFNALEYYTEKFNDLQSRISSGDYTSESDFGIESEIKDIISVLESYYPEFETLISNFTKMFENLYPQNNNVQSAAKDLDYYKNAYQNLFEYFTTNTKSAISDSNFSTKIRDLFRGLKKDFPFAESVIYDYEQLFESYNDIKNSIFGSNYDQKAMQFVDSYGQDNTKERIESLKNSIIELQKESLKLSKDLSSQSGTTYSKRYMDFEKQIKKATTSLASLQKQMLKGLSSKNAGKFSESEQFKILDQEIQETSKHLEELKKELETINPYKELPTPKKTGSGNKNIFGSFSKGLSSQAGKLQSTFVKINNVIGKIVTAPFNRLGNSIKNVNLKSNNLYKSLSRNYRMLRLMITRSILRSIIDLGRQGFQNLIQYSNECNRSFSMLWNSTRQLGNSVAAMVSPLLNALAPALNQIIQLAISATNAINQLLSSLLGRGTWIKAKDLTDDYASSLGGVNKQLAGIDELNNLTSGSGGGTNAADMFETVPIEQKWDDLAKKIKNILERLFEPLQKAWNKQGKFVMDSWKKAFLEIKKLGQDIGRDFLEVWGQDNTVKIFEDILHVVGNIGLQIGIMARKLRVAWNYNDTGLKTLEHIRDIILIVTDKISYLSDKTTDWVKSLNVIPLSTGLEQYFDSLKAPVQAISDILGSFYEDVLLPIGTWTIETGLPDLVKVFTDLNNNVDWERLNEMFAELNKHLAPFAEKVGEGLIVFIKRLTDKITEWLNNGGYEKLETWLDNLENWMDNTSAEDIADAIEDLVKAFIGLKVAIFAFNAAGAVMKSAGTLLTFLTNLKGLSGNVSSSIGTMSSSFGSLATALLTSAGATTTFHDSIKKIFESKDKKENADLLVSLRPKQEDFDSMNNYYNALINYLNQVDESVQSGKAASDELLGAYSSVKSEINLLDFQTQALESGKKVLDVTKNVSDGLTSVKTSYETNVKPTFSSETWQANGNNMSNGLSKAYPKIKSDMSTNFSDATSKAEKIINDFTERVAKVLGNVGKSLLDGVVNATNELNNKNLTVKAPTVNGKSIPAYAAGGFPEDGLFYANHSELVGSFANGRTAVANNEQILSGIENGVARAVSGVVAPYLQQLVASNNEIASKDIEVSSDGIFKSVRNSAKSFSRMTGQHNAFTF